MNNTRRKKIRKVIHELESVKNQLESTQLAESDAVLKIVNLNQAIQEIADEEQDSFDNMPESLQASDRGAQSEAAIDILNDAVSEAEGLGSDASSEEIIEAIEAIISSLEEASE